jgi:hypothetical protein
MNLLRTVVISLCTLLALAGIGAAENPWTPLNHQPGVNLGPMIQLRDGRILVHEEQFGNAQAWHILTPDATGSYVNGTWSSGGLLPSGYAPFYFGSQLLLNGRQLVIEGGEYNFGSAVWTNLGAIGTVVPYGAVTWTANSPPTGLGHHRRCREHHPGQRTLHAVELLHAAERDLPGAELLARDRLG